MPRPLVLPLRPIVTVRRRPHRLFAVALGTSLALNLAAAGRMIPAAQAPADVIARVTPTAPVAAVVTSLPADPEPPCALAFADPDPARWTIGPDHVGPFPACALEASMLGAIRNAWPDLAFEPGATEDEPGSSTLEVTHRGKPLVTIRAGGVGAGITIHSPTIATPWGIRVGDRISRVREHHRGLNCRFAGAEGDELLYCQVDDYEGGYADGLTYHLDVHRLTPAEHEVLAGGDDLPIERFDRFVVRSITWRGKS